MKMSIRNYSNSNEMPDNKQRQILSLLDEASHQIADWARNIRMGWSIPLPTHDSLFNGDMRIVTMEISGKKVIGFIQYYTYTSENHSDSQLGIHQIYVNKKYRNKGIGSNLVRYLMEKYEDHMFTINVWDQNEIGKKFWKSLGFVTPTYTSYIYKAEGINEETN